MHPYKTLNLSPESDSDSDFNSETIRQAYLDAVLLHPPESDPIGFKRINDAYEQIKTEELRVSREIRVGVPGTYHFSSPKEAAIAFLKADLDPAPPSEEAFYTFLKS